MVAVNRVLLWVMLKELSAVEGDPDVAHGAEVVVD
jgi:hypothetical protein